MSKLSIGIISQTISANSLTIFYGFVGKLCNGVLYRNSINSMMASLRNISITFQLFPNNVILNVILNCANDITHFYSICFYTELSRRNVLI